MLEILSNAALSYVTQAAGTLRNANPARVTDTIHVRVLDTVHVRVLDTLGIVLPSSSATRVTLVNALIALLAAVASIGAAIAAWRAASATTENAGAARASAAASSRQADAAEQQASLLNTQLQHLREQTAQRLLRSAKNLNMLARRLRAPLVVLRQKGVSHHFFLTNVVVDSADIQRLQDLAPEVSAEAITAATHAVVALNALFDAQARARQINESTGWAPTPEETERLGYALTAAIKYLEDITSMCDGLASATGDLRATEAGDS